MSARMDALLAKIDWQLLATQKLALLTLDLANADTAELLLGVVHLIDSLQDVAEDEGHPVVWLQDEDD